ncbi:glutamine amidotransferase [Spiractinospora alimapuensis]|uniref:type 1 glutamine amidotransferase n=1 Tax=Spiractinospora alimapuensis TaxID=2820884 RepID=UPI001F1B79FE|nr:glutamine amidotransferase [Spiractinospora alimapuensis]QVQ50632.1 glutamine amidotransferase [Spiractinospora alimapuensis]
MGDTSSTLRIVWIYPDLLSTYGDRGNALILQRRAELRGIRTEIVEVNSSDPVPTEGDVYVLGGGEDRPQILAAERLRADGGLARAARRGKAILAICAGYQIIGESYGDDAANPLPGVGILDIRSGRGDKRAVGEIVADVDPMLGIGRITGFENHQGRTEVGGNAFPLSRTVRGIGNGSGTEGAYSGRIIGSYLHGPALPRNPALADLLLQWAVGSDLAPLEPGWGEYLHKERLAAVQ